MEKIEKKYNSLPIQMRASLWFVICAFLQKGITCLTVPVFTRLLSVEQYGRVEVFTSWYNILLIIMSLNLWGGVYVQGSVKNEDCRKQFSSSLQGLNLTLMIFWTVIYIIGKNYWNNIFSLSTKEFICMIIMVWTTSVYSFWAANERIDYKYKRIVIVTIITSVLKPFVGIVLVYFGEDKAFNRILGLTIVELLMYSWCFFEQLYKGKKFYDKKYWQYVLKFNIPLLPHYLSNSILNTADRIMINSFCGASEAGIYSLAYSISMIMTLFNTALFQTIEPWIYKQIKRKEITTIKMVAYPCFIFIGFINVGLALCAPEVIHIFAPPEYYDAIWVIPPVAASVLFKFSYTFFATFEFYYEKKSYITIATFIGAGINIVLNYICIPRYGYISAAYTTLVCYIIFSVMHYFFMHIICKQYIDNVQPYNIGVLCSLAISMLILCLGILTIYKYTILRYGIILIALVIIFIFRKSIIRFAQNIVELKKSK